MVNLEEINMQWLAMGGSILRSFLACYKIVYLNLAYNEISSLIPAYEDWHNW